MKGLSFQLWEEQLPGPLAALECCLGSFVREGQDQQLLPAMDEQDT